MWHGGGLTEAGVMFVAWMEMRGLSQSTVRRRVSTLKAFSAFLAPKPPQEATTEDVEDFLRLYPHPRTRHAYRSDLRVLYRWAHKRGLCSVDPTEDVDTIRVPKGLPRPMNRDLVPAIIALADDADTRLMLALAAYAGLRRSEIARLCGEDVSVSARMLVVRDGKGRKDRTVPINDELATMLAGRGTGRLLPYHHNTIYKRITRHVHQLGIEHGNPHRFRHSFGTELAIITRGDMQLVKDLMGHEQLSSTEGYCEFADRGSAEVVGKLYAAS